MANNAGQLSLIISAAVAAIVGIFLKYAQQPNEICAVLAAVALVAVYPLVDLIQKKKAEAEKKKNDDDDYLEDFEDEEEEVIVKPVKEKKKKKTRAQQKKLAREANKEVIAAAKAKKQAELKAEQDRIAAEKAAEEAAAKAAADAESHKGKKRRKKKGKKSKDKKHEGKKTEAATLVSDDEPEPEVVENAWQEVEKRHTKKAVTADAEEDDGSTQIELKIDQKHYAKIIGKQGATLKLLQEATQAEIQMPKKGVMLHEIIIIKGQPAAVELAKTNLLQLAHKGYSSITEPLWDEDSITVARRQHGLLMGKSGTNIRAIQDSTNTRIVMPERGSGSDKVTIVGDMTSIAQAKLAIHELLSKGFSETTHPGWQRIEIPFPKELLSNLIGKGGETIRLLQSRYGVTINTPPDSAIISSVSILGPADNVKKAEAEVRNLSILEEADVDPCWGGNAAGFDLSQLNAW